MGMAVYSAELVLEKEERLQFTSLGGREGIPRAVTLKLVLEDKHVGGESRRRLGGENSTF